ncbi:MAG: hypothetical protein JWM96_1224 [Alphaproteobacteria bacterium]|nr:hypothetical protein [Alphaproteobacteria bacterium]
MLNRCTDFLESRGKYKAWWWAAALWLGGITACATLALVMKLFIFLLRRVII